MLFVSYRTTIIDTNKLHFSVKQRMHTIISLIHDIIELSISQTRKHE